MLCEGNETFTVAIFRGLASHGAWDAANLAIWGLWTSHLVAFRSVRKLDPAQRSTLARLDPCLLLTKVWRSRVGRVNSPCQGRRDPPRPSSRPPLDDVNSSTNKSDKVLSRWITAILYTNSSSSSPVLCLKLHQTAITYSHPRGVPHAVRFRLPISSVRNPRVLQ